MSTAILSDLSGFQTAITSKDDKITTDSSGRWKKISFSMKFFTKMTWTLTVITTAEVTKEDLIAQCSYGLIFEHIQYHRKRANPNGPNWWRAKEQRRSNLKDDGYSMLFVNILAVFMSTKLHPVITVYERVAFKSLLKLLIQSRLILVKFSSSFGSNWSNQWIQTQRGYST